MSPACLSMFRCWEMVAPVVSKCSTICPAVMLVCFNRLSISRRVGSDRRAGRLFGSAYGPALWTNCAYSGHMSFLPHNPQQPGTLWMPLSPNCFSHYFSAYFSISTASFRLAFSYSLNTPVSKASAVYTPEYQVNVLKKSFQKSFLKMYPWRA